MKRHESNLHATEAECTIVWSNCRLTLSISVPNSFMKNAQILNHDSWINYFQPWLSSQIIIIIPNVWVVPPLVKPELVPCHHTPTSFEHPPGEVSSLRTDSWSLPSYVQLQRNGETMRNLTTVGYFHKKWIKDSRTTKGPTSILSELWGQVPSSLWEYHPLSILYLYNSRHLILYLYMLSLPIEVSIGFQLEISSYSMYWSFHWSFQPPLLCFPAVHFHFSCCGAVPWPTSQLAPLPHRRRGLGGGWHWSQLAVSIKVNLNEKN